jgi:hypothetical protein
MSVHRPSRSIYRARAFDQPSGMPPSRRVCLSSLVSRGRRASTNGCINDLPAHGQETALGQHCVEAREQLRQRARARQLFAVEPDRLGVGHRILQRQADEAH